MSAIPCHFSVSCHLSSLLIILPTKTFLVPWYLPNYPHSIQPSWRIFIINHHPPQSFSFPCEWNSRLSVSLNSFLWLLFLPLSLSDVFLHDFILYHQNKTCLNVGFPWSISSNSMVVAVTPALMLTMQFRTPGSYSLTQVWGLHVSLKFTLSRTTHIP